MSTLCIDLLPGEPTPIKCTLTLGGRLCVAESNPDISPATCLIYPDLINGAILVAFLLNVCMDVVEELWFGGHGVGHVESSAPFCLRRR